MTVLSSLDVRLWWRCHDLAWRAGELCCRHPFAAVLAVWLIGPRLPLAVRLALAGIGVLAALTAAGPDVRTRTSTLFATLAFVYRRVYVRMTFQRAMVAAKLVQIMTLEDSIGSARGAGYKETPKLLRRWPYRIKRIRGGMILTVDGSRIGAGYSAFGGDQSAVLKSKWHVHSIIITPHPRKPHLTLLKLIYKPPFEQVIKPSELPPPSKPGNVVVGKSSEYEPVEKNMRLCHLIAGSSGAGKSSEVWMILRSLVRQRLPFLVACFDPKGGQEFGNLKPAAFRYESDPTKWLDFLTEALRDLEQRQNELGARDCPLGDVRYPLYVMVIDELLSILAMMKGAKLEYKGQKIPAINAFMIYLSQARAAGHVVIACTQLTQKEAIGVIRDLFTYTTCLRVASDEMVRTILGDPKLYPAHLIPAGDEFAGIGYMNTDTGALMYRAAFVDSAERDEIAQAIGELSEDYRERCAA